MPKYDKYHAKWKANMAKCSKYHAKCKVTMPKCNKYHAKWQVLVPNCCKYKANGTRKENQKKTKPEAKKTKTILHPLISPLKMVIFHSYVSLLEGVYIYIYFFSPNRTWDDGLKFLGIFMGWLEHGWTLQPAWITSEIKSKIFRGMNGRVYLKIMGKQQLATLGS